MRRILAIAVFVFGFSAIAVAQGTPMRVPPRPSGTPALHPDLRRSDELSRRSENLRMTEKFPARTAEEKKVFNEKIWPIYRDSTKEEREALAPTEAVAGSYAAFLNKKDTGITRLSADIGCFTQDDVVSAKPECLKYTMPGSGSSYSFRIDDYRIQRLADINFKKDQLEALGTLNHGILVYLGDVPIEEVSLDSEGVKYLLKIDPAENFSEAGAFADKLLRGFKNNDFVYASVMKAIPGRTYVLRSIAYQGEAKRVINGLIFNELELDERRDVIVSFRVAAMNPGEDITLVWQELRNKKAPKLEAPK